MRTRRILAVVAVSTTLAVAVVGSIGAVVARAADKIDPASLPKALHASIEAKAFTPATGMPNALPAVGSLLIDPSTAYAYSAFDRDDFGQGTAPSYFMTARGANLDPGTIAAAAIWGAPDCRAQNVPCFLTLMNQTSFGLENAKGFPAYAEALFPDQPGQPSLQHTYKCIVNKDANGSPPTSGQAQQVCQQGGQSVPLSAWAEAVGDEYRTTGFSRAGGVDQPGALHIGGSESTSDIRPSKDGSLETKGFAAVTNIDLGGGQVHIDKVRAEADIVSTADKVLKKTAKCTVSGLVIGGQKIVDTEGKELPAEQISQALDGVYQATGFRIEIKPPTGPQLGVVENVKQTAGCTGPVIRIADEKGSSGIREEITFGQITAAQSVNNFATGADAAATGDTTAAAGDVTAGAGAPSVEAANVSAPPSEPTADTGLPTPFANPSAATPSGSGSGTRSVGRSRNGSSASTGDNAGAGYKLVKPSLASVAGWSAGAASALGLCVWLLLGVVGSLSKGRPLRLPGL